MAGHAFGADASELPLAVAGRAVSGEVATDERK